MLLDENIPRLFYFFVLFVFFGITIETVSN